MAPHRQFANYPGAKEATNISYATEEAQNPVMRGLPLAIGAAMSVCPFAPFPLLSKTERNTSLTCATVTYYSITRSPALQRFLYSNAGFGKLSAIEGLSDEPWRFDVSIP